VQHALAAGDDIPAFAVDLQLRWRLRPAQLREPEHRLHVDARVRMRIPSTTPPFSKRDTRLSIARQVGHASSGIDDGGQMARSPSGLNGSVRSPRSGFVRDGPMPAY
jgi:hypothetical protein